MFSESILVATTDGGATWQKQDPGTTRQLAGIAFADGFHGWVVGDYGRILATTTAGWAPDRTFVITPSVVGGPDGHGTISPGTPVSATVGSTPSFSFTPDPGYRLGRVLVDGLPVSPDSVGSYTFPPVAEDHTISVSFTPITYAVSALAVTAGGTVSPSGATLVPFGGAVTVTVTPAPYHHTAGVTIDGVPVAVRGSYAFTNVAASHALRASFAPDSYAITPSVVNLPDGRAHGSVSPSTLGTYVWGTTPTFRFTPERGYAVFEVRVDGAPVLPTPRTSYTFAPLTGPHTISVRFSKAYVPKPQ